MLESQTFCFHLFSFTSESSSLQTPLTWNPKVTWSFRFCPPQSGPVWYVQQLLNRFYLMISYYFLNSFFKSSILICGFFILFIFFLSLFYSLPFDFSPDHVHFLLSTATNASIFTHRINKSTLGPPIKNWAVHLVFTPLGQLLFFFKCAARLKVTWWDWMSIY